MSLLSSVAVLGLGTRTVEGGQTLHSCTGFPFDFLRRAGALEQLHVLLLRPKLNESVRVVVRYKVDEAVAEVADPVKPACARSVKDFRWAGITGASVRQRSHEPALDALRRPHVLGHRACKDGDGKNGT